MRMNRRGFLRAVVASPVAVLGVPEKKRVAPAVKEIPATVMAQASSSGASSVCGWVGSTTLGYGAITRGCNILRAGLRVPFPSGSGAGME